MHTERCRQGEGRALGRVLPPYAQHTRDCVGSHPLPTCPMLAKRTWRHPTAAPHSPAATHLSSWIQSKVSEQQVQLHGHNCLHTGCLLEAEIMIAFKANMLGKEGVETGGKGPRNQ